MSGKSPSGLVQEPISPCKPGFPHTSPERFAILTRQPYLPIGARIPSGHRASHATGVEPFGGIGRVACSRAARGRPGCRQPAQYPLPGQSRAGAQHLCRLLPGAGWIKYGCSTKPGGFSPGRPTEHEKGPQVAFRHHRRFHWPTADPLVRMRHLGLAHRITGFHRHLIRLVGFQDQPLHPLTAVASMINRGRRWPTYGYLRPVSPPMALMASWGPFSRVPSNLTPLQCFHGPTVCLLREETLGWLTRRPVFTCAWPVDLQAHHLSFH